MYHVSAQGVDERMINVLVETSVSVFLPPLLPEAVLISRQHQRNDTGGLVEGRNGGLFSGGHTH